MRIANYLNALQREYMAHRDWEAAQAKRNHELDLMRAYPEIGKLNGGLFYAFIDGYDSPEFAHADIDVVVAAIEAK